MTTSKSIDNVQEGIILMNLNGEIEYVNGIIEELLLFSLEQLKGHPISEVVIGFDMAREWPAITGSIINGTPYEFPPIKLLKCNGRTTVARIRGFSLKRPSGSESWIVFYVHDISKEINTSIELERRNRELTRENSILLKESSNFKRISELKTKFLGIASHELKTPLTSIKGYSEILLDTMDDQLNSEVRRMVERISRAADKLHHVINDMLDVTRIEQNRLRLRPEDLNLEVTVHEVLEELSQFLVQKEMLVTLDITPSLPLMYGDKTRIHQVFTNVLTNAIKYSPSKTTITISITVTSDDQFCIKIQDEGIGIDPMEQGHIFSPFYEVNNTVNHGSSSNKILGGGTGLGLSIVKGIVQRHGGTIEVESEGPNGAQKGSTFIITLPKGNQVQWNDDETQMMRLQTIMGQPIGAAADEMQESLDDSSERLKKILIIDDDAEAVEICRVIFNKKYEILTSATGEVGLRIAFRDKPDLILVNFYLPGLQGTQVCRILKSQDETRHIPIAFFSAATQDKEIEQCYASGGDDFIVKPFSGKEITEKVTQMLMMQQNSALFLGLKS